MPEPPEEWSWSSPQSPEAQNSTNVPPASLRRLHPEHDFRRAVRFTIAGTVLPGLGLIAARRRVLGGVILAVFVAALMTVGVWALVDLEGLASLAVRPGALKVASVVLVVVALAWVTVVVASHLALRGLPSRGQRVIGAVLVGILAFAVAAPMAVAARLTYVQANALSTVFKSDKNIKSATRPAFATPKPAQPGQTQQADPWADKPRLNVLLLGGDADKGRPGTRTDTVILASIDTKTGDTVLFSLPRNTGRMPFPRKSPLHKYYPNGFTTGDGNDPEHFLNAMYRNLPSSVPKNVLGETDNLGADALKLSVGAALGLDVDYYALVQLTGFKKLINALGGIRVNINTYIPIGGNTDLHIKPKDYLHPGANQKLDGHDALWYARGRYGLDDFSRMDRQRCVINAIIKQANPANVLARYEDIVQAGTEIVTTDMPQEVLPLMVELALRVKGGNVRSIVFKHGVAGFSSPNPDFALMRKRVEAALGEAKAAGAKPSGGTSKKGGSSGNSQSEDVSDSCAFQPKVAAAARRPQ